jgi:NADH dehydrogenase
MKAQNKIPRIVIVGCGFGGLALAKELSKLKVEILVVDKHNYHTFSPYSNRWLQADLKLITLLTPSGKYSEK